MDNITVVPLPDKIEIGETFRYEDKILISLGHGDDDSRYWIHAMLDEERMAFAANKAYKAPGQYDYLFTWPECSEEDCTKVVKTFQVRLIGSGEYISLYKNYEVGKSHITAKSSFTSWLRSQGHNPESKFAILKKKV
jgi:hypothetical protein